MRVSRTGALVMLVIAVLWAAMPAMACLVPLRAMTPAEHDCCMKMAQECGSSTMPSSHSCCQERQRNTAVSPTPLYAATRPFEVAIVPQISILVVVNLPVSFPVPALEAPPPESSPGASSILRI